MKFSEMGLSNQLLDAVASMGFDNPTPIQEQAIPLLLLGDDLIGQAKTGTGKTAAFGLPMLELWLKEKAKNPQTQHRAPEQIMQKPRYDVYGSREQPRSVANPTGLILVPTRELAVQVNQSLHHMAKNSGARIVPIYGGVSMHFQLKQFNHPVDIVVGTPGRILDHAKQGTLKLGSVRTLVLDEADHMFDMGFIRDVVKIIEMTPRERQTMLFSATMPREIMGLAHKYLKNPKTIKVSEDDLTVDKIKQLYVSVQEGNKISMLLSAIQTLKPKLSLVFCRTKHGAKRLAKVLRLNGINADAMHGNLSQNAREQTMARFRAGECDLLVATDLASRGIDVSNITHVFNYDMPHDTTTYVHRIGRTARAGLEGCAVSLISGNPRREVDVISRATGAKLEELILSPVAANVPAHEDRQHGRDSHSHSGSGRNFGSDRGSHHAPSHITAGTSHQAHGGRSHDSGSSSHGGSSSNRGGQDHRSGRQRSRDYHANRFGRR